MIYNSLEYVSLFHNQFLLCFAIYKERFFFSRNGEICPEMHAMANLAILTKFRRRAIELEIGVPMKGDFDESGEFGENSNFDEILPKSD